MLASSEKTTAMHKSTGFHMQAGTQFILLRAHANTRLIRLVAAVGTFGNAREKAGTRTPQVCPPFHAACCAPLTSSSAMLVRACGRIWTMLLVARRAVGRGGVTTLSAHNDRRDMYYVPFVLRVA